MPHPDNLVCPKDMQAVTDRQRIPLTKTRTAENVDTKMSGKWHAYVILTVPYLEYDRNPKRQASFGNVFSFSKTD